MDDSRADRELSKHILGNHPNPAKDFSHGHNLLRKLSALKCATVVSTAREKKTALTAFLALPDLANFE